MGNSPADQHKDPGTTPIQATPSQPEDPVAQEFAPTQVDESAENANDWWPESSDGQCSESAALFAASQPAPLSIV